jgi:membrane-associated protein
MFNPLDFILNIDTSLAHAAGEYGILIYAILFLIIFCETGLVFFPFLPGDSLLFIGGALAGTGSLNLPLLLGVTLAGAVLGDTVNFWIGRYAGEKIIEGRFSSLIRGEWIDLTHNYFEKYGGITIIIARFVPYVRTFAPFIAGIGKMNYSSFLIYNVTGGVLWTFGLVLAGYFIGNIPIVQSNIPLLMGLVLILCLFAVVMIAKTLISAIFPRKK